MKSTGCQDDLGEVVGNQCQKLSECSACTRGIYTQMKNKYSDCDQTALNDAIRDCKAAHPAPPHGGGGTPSSGDPDGCAVYNQYCSKYTGLHDGGQNYLKQLDQCCSKNCKSFQNNCYDVCTQDGSTGECGGGQGGGPGGQGGQGGGPGGQGGQGGDSDDPSKQCGSSSFPESGCWQYDGDDKTCAYFGKAQGPQCTYSSCSKCFDGHGRDSAKPATKAVNKASKAGGGSSGGNSGSSVGHKILITLLIIALVAAFGGTAFLFYKKVHKTAE